MRHEVELLLDLVGQKSVSGQEGAACRYLAGRLPGLGWGNVYIDEVGNVVAERGTGEREVLLMGHIDTVPGGPPVELEDDILWGRGAVDAKGPLCAFAVAGGAVEIPQEYRIVLVAAVGEETDSRGAAYRMSLHSPSACIIGEPSGVSGVTLGYRGCVRLLLRGEDTGAHRSSDAGPLTACLRCAAEILKYVEDTDDPGRPLIERPSGAVAFMRGVDAGERNAEIELDLRLPLGARPDEWLGIVRNRAEKWGVELSVKTVQPAHLVDRSDPVPRALRVAIRQAGLRPRLLAKGGTADFNLAAGWKCPMAAYGPGDSHLDHTAEEHIFIPEYLSAIEVLKRGLPLLFDYLKKN